MPNSDDALKTLRSNISDLSHQIDSYKTKTAAAIGGGVFLLLLALLATCDLVAGHSGVWLNVGITRENLIWIAIVLGSGAIILLAIGLVLIERRDVELDHRLEQMEEEYAELLERREVKVGTGESEHLPEDAKPSA